VSLKFRVLDRN